MYTFRLASWLVRRGYEEVVCVDQLRTKLIEALNRLTFSSRRAQLKIYGDPNVFPDYAQSLRKTADGNSAVELAGRFDNRRVAEILNQTDVVVAPSIWYENSPIAILEALTTGTPVVTAYLSWDITNNGRSSV